MQADKIIEIKNLSFIYPRTISGRTCTALRNISLDIRQGEMVIITGPSGSGKSTFCRCLNGLIPHARKGTMKGDVVVAGMNTRNHYITDYSPIIGLVFQNPDDHLVTGDVDSEIAFGPEQLGWNPSDIERGIQMTVHALGIEHLRGRAIQELSWGERQRVAIASVTVINPRILVLDEPLSGIDETGSMFLIDYLLSLNERDNTTVIVIEHRLDRVHRIARRIVTFSDGTIIFDGSGTQFFRSQQFSKVEHGHIDYREYGGGPVTGMHPPVISLRNVSYSYPGSSRPSLSDVNLDFYPYEIAFIKGPNGSGKSTLIRHLNGILTPDKGAVLVSGRPIKERTVADLSRTVGTLLQHADYQLFEETISEELAFAPKNFGLSEEEIALRSRVVSEDLDISHLGPDTPPLSLSAGEKQRVAIGGLLMMRSPVIALDEPTIGLDYRLKSRLAGLMKRYRNEGTAIIIATHDREFSTLCADRIVRMSEGIIIADYRVRSDEPPLSREHAGRTGSQ
jgi:energy-coupling factor transporter ATP-binding protein EcfA2